MSSICLYLERYKNRSLFGKKLPIPLCSSRDGCLLEPQDDNDRYWSHKRQRQEILGEPQDEETTTTELAGVSHKR